MLSVRIPQRLSSPVLVEYFNKGCSPHSVLKVLFFGDVLQDQRAIAFVFFRQFLFRFFMTASIA